MEFACLLIRSAPRPAESSKYPTLLCAPAGRSFAGVRGAILFPGMAHVRIKRFSLLSPQRILVMLKGATRSALARGTILIEESAPIYLTRAAYAVSTGRIREGVYRMEGGLFHGHRLPGTVTVEPRSSGYFLRASADLPLLPGARYRLIQAASAPGREAAAAGESPAVGPPIEIRLCIPGEVPSRRQGELAGFLKRLSEGFDRDLLFHTLVRIYGWAALPATTESARGKPAARGAQHGSAERDGHRIVVGSRGVRYWMREKRLTDFEREVERHVRGSGGTTVRRLSAELDLPEDLVDAIASALFASGTLERRGGLLVESGLAVGLPPLERSLENLLRGAPADRPLLHARTREERRLLDKLARLNIAVRIGDAFCHRERYEAMVQAILSGGHPGERVTPESARQRVDVSRASIEGLLSHMESQGLLRREGGICRIAHGTKPLGQ